MPSPLENLLMARDTLIFILQNLEFLINMKKYLMKMERGTRNQELVVISKDALAQVKASNNSENLLNEIKQIVYSLYQSKEITKKVYNNIIKSI